MSVHAATISTHSLSAALQRIEKTMPVQSPSNFTFSHDQSLDMIKYLQNSIKIKDKSNLIVQINIKFGDTLLKELYPPIVDKFLNINPPLSPFQKLIISDEITSMLQFVTWIVLFDIIDDCYYPEGIDDVRRTIYDKLSIDFSLLQKKLNSSTLSLSDRFIELWSSVVCASIFTLVLTIYQDSELYRNTPFALRIENDVRFLLVGFASPNVKDYHRSIVSIMPNDLKIAVASIVTVGGEDYSTELTTALTYEPQIVNAWNSRKDMLLMATTTTGLMENAMKLKGARIVAPNKKGRTVKKGNVEKSGLPIAKARVVLKNTETMFKTYDTDRSKVIYDICATEETYKEVPTVPPITQLGITFENFTKAPPKPPMATSVRSPRPRPKTTRAPGKRNASARSTRPPGSPRFKYHKVPDVPEIISKVQEVNDYLLTNPPFNC
ncbi:hypothetical protein TRFO_17499 [Tritrichomonas foetus]|uniref:Uncharacterized protein n=1 Tax=Tritrichomonas foetus TaxID=1144522 RepID=A0A1J4KNG5_9EUKA|nr:hypothetical protein TRFO_17499 [Tritrichomonas foetus]|eukprot:OHT12666.1 hypothetical protein TRFO_17499 [Tritrichomonas foetus]